MWDLQTAWEDACSVPSLVAALAGIWEGAYKDHPGIVLVTPDQAGPAAVCPQLTPTELRLLEPRGFHHEHSGTDVGDEDAASRANQCHGTL